MRLLFEGGHNPGKIAACFLHEVQACCICNMYPLTKTHCRLKVSKSTPSTVTIFLGEYAYKIGWFISYFVGMNIARDFFTHCDVAAGTYELLTYWAVHRLLDIEINVLMFYIIPLQIYSHI